MKTINTYLKFCEELFYLQEYLLKSPTKCILTPKDYYELTNDTLRINRLNPNKYNKLLNLRGIELIERYYISESYFE